MGKTNSHFTPIAWLLWFSTFFTLFGNGILIHAETNTTSISIAVLNFISQTGDRRIDAMLSVGTSETIMTDLSNVFEINVVERAMLRQINEEITYSQTGMIDEATAQSVGKQVGADYVIIGGWQKFGEKFRVNARLVKVESGEVVESIKETGWDVFQMQDNIVSAILRNLKVIPSTNEIEKIKERETVSIEAYKEFSLGLQAFESKDENTMEQHMEKAIRIDPNYEKPKKYIYITSFDPEILPRKFKSKKIAQTVDRFYILFGSTGVFYLMSGFEPVGAVIGFTFGLAIVLSSGDTVKEVPVDNDDNNDNK